MYLTNYIHSNFKVQHTHEEANEAIPLIEVQRLTGPRIAILCTYNVCKNIKIHKSMYKCLHSGKIKRSNHLESHLFSSMDKRQYLYGDHNTINLNVSTPCENQLSTTKKMSGDLILSSHLS